MRKLILTAALVVVFSTESNAQVSSLIGVGYTNASGHGGALGGGSTNMTWGESGINTQLDVLYGDTDVSGVDLQDWSLGGDIFWRGAKGAIGATVQYDKPKASASAGAFAFSFSTEITSYGGFAEWYVYPRLTLQAKAGGFSGQYGISGEYGGLGAKAYLLPRHQGALQLGYDYINLGSGLGHLSAATVGLEYMPLPRLPAAFGIAYQRSFESGGSDAVMATITFRFGDGSYSDLRTSDRAGVSRITGGMPLLSGSGL